MNLAALPDPPQSPAGVLTRHLSPDRSIRAIRGLLLSGYGKGASEATITACTRDRQVVGGVPTTTRLAWVAHQTSAARDVETGLLSLFRHSARRLTAVAATGMVFGALVRGLLRRR